MVPCPYGPLPLWPAEVGRRKRIPGHESSKLYESGRDALHAAGDPKGEWNWALVGPDVQTMPLLGGGSGSAEEMREFIEENPDSVMFGLVRR